MQNIFSIIILTMCGEIKDYYFSNCVLNSTILSTHLQLEVSCKTLNNPFNISVIIIIPCDHK